MILRAAPILVLALLAGSTPATAPNLHDASGLPVIGSAPEFALHAQDGAEVTLRQYRGKAVAVAFIFASCSVTCPVLMGQMATVQDRLGADFGRKVAFLSITVDPEHDTPDVLRRYADTFGADPAGWKFLTGAPSVIQDLERHYGVFATAAPGREIEHTTLTSLVDKHGMLRVQYLGVRFDPEEFRHDLLSLVEQP